MRYIKTAAILAGAFLLLEGCLKSKSINFANENSPSPNTVDFNNQEESAALDIVATPTIYTFYAELNSSNKTYPSGSVTITKTPSIIAAYNTANSTNYTFLPDSSYQLLNNTATIDPVTHLAAFQLKVFTTKIDLSGAFAVAYTISAAPGGSVIASNKNTTLIFVGAKNKYDGIYSLNMKLTGWTAYGIADGVSATYPLDIYIITAGINSVTMDAPDGPFGNLQPGFTGTANQPGTLTGYTAFGATTPKYTFDNSTNQLTSVVNTTPDDGRGRTLFLNPAITTSRFDPATKTIYAAYVMTQNGRPNMFIYDTLHYLGPR